MDKKMMSLLNGYDRFQNSLQKNWVKTTAISFALVAGVSCFSVAMAETLATLEKMDLISESNSTTINLYTGTIVPFKQVHRSANKLVIDFDNVTAPRTIATNLSKAKNISHVIFQPVSDSKIRMIVKGNNLGNGVIHFKENPKTKSLIESLASAKTNAQTELASTKQFIKTGSQLIAPPEPALNEKPVTQKQNQKQPQQSVTEAPPEPMETILTDSSIDSDRITESPSEVLNTLLTSETDSNQGNESLSDNLSTNILGLSDADLGADVEPLNVDESGIESEADFFSADTNLTETDTLFASETGLEEVRPIIPESGQASANPLSGINWQAILPPIDGDLAKPLAGVVILMVGLGLFIRRKMSQIKEGRQQHSASALNNQRYNRRQSTRLSFNALAQSHRNQSLDPSEMPTNMPAPEAKPLFTPNDHPKKANKWATKPQPKKPSKNPVGLGALLNAIPDKPFVERPQLQPKPAKSKAAQPKPLNKRQVVNQYQQQQNMAKKPVGAKPVPKKPAVQKQPNTINPVQVARKTASKKLDSIKSQRSPQRQAQSLTGGNANEPIPGNPQVLDFLKNVADYMERDGNSQRAQSIQKNLRNYQ